MKREKAGCPARRCGACGLCHADGCSAFQVGDGISLVFEDGECQPFAIFEMDPVAALQLAHALFGIALEALGIEEEEEDEEGPDLPGDGIGPVAGNG